MTGWNEDNFLEEITPLLRRKLGAARCPEAGAFSTIADAATSETLKRAVDAHASACPDCRDLQQRLAGFDGPMATDDDTEWRQAERRLDRWLESFLASDAASHQGGDRPKASRLRLCWERLTQPVMVRRLRWVLVPAGTLAVVVASFLVGRFSVRRLPQVGVDVVSSNNSPAKVPPPRTSVEQRATAREPAQGPELPQPARPSRGSVIASTSPRRMIPPAASAGAPNVPPTDAAVLMPAAPGNSESAPILSPVEPQHNPTGVSVPIAPPERSEHAVETAGASGTAPSVGATGSGVPSSRRTTLRPVAGSPGIEPAPAARAAPLPAISAPPMIRLDAGTRVWIALKSVRSRPDGVSEFRGAVLLPVTQSGATLLGRNTEVSGTMSVRNGKRSVQILEFLSPGARYRLRSAGGEADLRLLGAGEVVQFDAGRVLETWMAAVSTYEKQSDESRPLK